MILKQHQARNSLAVSLSIPSTGVVQISLNHLSCNPAD